ncbi:hypothetical protein KLP28_08865 [Nocardioidaceae bacterium]|nr:hypothetical protein KLP28_08865 [Nocardioidaceae bacterium]
MELERTDAGVVMRLSEEEAAYVATALGGVVDRTPGETLDAIFSELVVAGVLTAGRWYVEENPDHDPDDEDSEGHLYVVE